jgi:hypothetical protein
MTITELKKHPDYQAAMRKVKGYSKGFRFTLNYDQIPKAKGNALKILMRECCDLGVVESVQMGLDLQGNIASETYCRL